MSNLILLLQSFAIGYPEDNLDIVASKNSSLQSLSGLKNVDFIPVRGFGHREIDRLLLGAHQLGNLAKDRRADVVWSLNLGHYYPLTLPSVLSVHNPHMVYPWSVTKHHPNSFFHVAAMRWFFRRSLRLSDGVIVQTPIMRKYIQSIPGAPKKIISIFKAVETSSDVAAKPLPVEILNTLGKESSCRDFTFLYVATYTPHKNHITLLRAFDELMRRGIRARIVLTVEGRELKLLNYHGLDEMIKQGTVVPIGWTSKEHLRALYESSDACLMPSVLESLSSTHLEAMEWGKPQLVSDLPYARDLCGDAALYVSPEDPQAWASAIVQVMSSSSLREKLIVLGRERMRTFPGSWNEVATQVRGFLEGIVQTTQRSSH